MMKGHILAIFPQGSDLPAHKEGFWHTLKDGTNVLLRNGSDPAWAERFLNDYDEQFNPPAPVIKLMQPSGIVGDGAEFEPDHILEKAKGGFQQVLVVGFDNDGQIALCSSHGSRDALWILQRAILHLMLETD